VHPIGPVGDGVLVAVFVIGIWWLSTHGKGGAALRLVAWVLLPVILWLMIAVHDPAQAEGIASGAASGVATDIGAFSQLFSAL
jgi:hypothetical protein